MSNSSTVTASRITLPPDWLRERRAAHWRLVSLTVREVVVEYGLSSGHVYRLISHGLLRAKDGRIARADVNQLIEDSSR